VHDVKMSLDRLLAARNAVVVHELGLSAAPPVVVTAEAKKTEAPAQHLNVPVESCLLFDDHVELRDDPHVVLVEPLESLPADRREQLLEFMPLRGTRSKESKEARAAASSRYGRAPGRGLDRVPRRGKAQRDVLELRRHTRRGQ